MVSEREPTAAGAATTTEEENRVTSERSEGNDSDDNVRDEKVPPAPVVTKRQKFKRHCGRFKWWYLLGVIILLAILLPILFKVIVPALMQKILNDQKVPIHSGAVIALSPTHINMSMLTSLDTPLPAQLEPTDLLLYNSNSSPDYYFTKLQLPGQKISGNTEISVVNQTLLITNSTGLSNWFDSFFVSETVALSLKGDPHVKLGKLEYSAKLDKTVEVPGLNYLKGFGIIDMDFMLKNNESEFNMKGHLNIPNPSVLALGFGNMTFNVEAGKIKIGVITIYGVVLQPGDNTIYFNAKLFFDQLIPNLSEILNSQKEALGRGALEIFATGNKTVIDGTRIPYIESVIATKRVPMELSVISLLASLAGGLMDTDQDSLLDIFGEAVGNRTLFEGLLDHWGDAKQGGSGNGNTKRTPVKKAKVHRSLMWNILKLGLKKRRS